MKAVRDDPAHPDPGFAELYTALPYASELEPWLRLAAGIRPPVLYLGIGAGRLAVPLAEAGVELVGVDAHPGMLATLRRRLPGIEVHLALLEALDLGQTFDLVMAPSSLLDTEPSLAAAARHVGPGGKLAYELLNPHWLEVGGSESCRVLRLDRASARIEVDYPTGHTQHAEVRLNWPEEVEERLAGVGLELTRLWGRPEAETLAESAVYFVLAARPERA